MCEHILINTPSGLWKTPSTLSSECVSPLWACYPTLCNHTAWLSLSLPPSLSALLSTDHRANWLLIASCEWQSTKVLRVSGMYNSRAAVQRNAACVLDTKQRPFSCLSRSKNRRRDMMLLLRSSQGQKRAALRPQMSGERGVFRSIQSFKSCRRNNAKCPLS